MATQKEIDALISEFSPKKEEKGVYHTVKSRAKDVLRRDAQMLRTLAGGLLGGGVDLALLPEQLKASYKGKEGPESYSAKIRRKIDEATKGYTKPEEGLGQSALEIGSELVGGGGPLKLGAKAIGKLLPKTAVKSTKALKAIEKANELSARNLTAGATGVAGGMGAASLLPELKEGEEPGTLRGLANVLVPLAGGVVGGVGGEKAIAKHLLSPEQKKLLKVSKQHQRQANLAKLYGLDKAALADLARDRDLGIQGTIGTYSTRPMVTSQEFYLRRHPTAGKYFKDVMDANTKQYENLLGMGQNGFEEFEPATGGQLIQSGAEKLKGQREAEFAKEYGDVRQMVPGEAIVPGEFVAPVGSHVLDRFEKLSPSLQETRLGESKAANFIEQLAKSSEDLKKGKAPRSSGLSPVDQYIEAGLLTEGPQAQSLRKYPLKEQAAYLKDILGDIPLSKTPSGGLEGIEALRSRLGDVGYHSLVDIGQEAGSAASPYFGLLTDAQKGDLRLLSGQLKGAENKYLQKYHPEYYGKKKAVDVKFKQHKQAEQPVINKLLGSEKKPINEAQAFKDVASNLVSKPELHEVSTKALTPAKRKQLSHVLLKERTRKSPTGEITPFAYATAYEQQKPSVKKLLTKGWPPEERIAFEAASKSIMKRKGLSNLENVSGSSHHHEERGMVKRGLSAIGKLGKGQVMPLVEHLLTDWAAPKTQAKFLTDQKRLQRLAEVAKDVFKAKPLREELSLASTLKNAAARLPMTINKQREEEPKATDQDILNLIKEFGG